MIKILKKALFITIFSLGLVLNIYAMPSSDTDKDTLTHHLSTSKTANELFEKAMEQYEEDNLDSVIVLLKKAINIDKDFADAYDKLALVYMEKGDVYSRVLAERAIKKAIELRPDIIKYKLHHGKLILKQGFRYNARKKFDYILSLDPKNVEAFLELGRIYKSDMEDYKDIGGARDTSLAAFIDKEMLGYIYNLAEGDNSAADSVRKFLKETNESVLWTGNFNTYAKKDFGHAVIAFSKAFELDPGNMEALHNLSLLSLDAKMHDKFIDYQKRILKYYPDYKNAHLCLGLGYYNIGKEEMAYREYMKAKSLMTSEERSAFESPKYVVSHDKADYYVKLASLEKNEFEREFWKKRDPLFLSEYNERELEHYSRFAYANLKFGVSKWTSNDTLSGWKTERGKTLIRYGHPRFISRIKDHVVVTESGIKVYIYRAEIWFYDGFHIVFDDITGTNKYVISRVKEHKDFVKGTKYIDFVEALYREQPEIYMPPYHERRFEFVYYTASFRGDDKKSLVEVYYAVPVNELEPKKEKELMAANLKEGIFFFDEKWNDVDKIVSKEKISLSPKFDSTKNYYLIGMEQMKIEPGEYNFAIEFQEEESKNTGTYRDKINVDSYPFGELNISDILLASNIIPADEESKYTKNGLKIIPNPARLFQKNQLMNVYFEIYDLMVNPENKTKFVVEYKVSAESEDKKPIISRVFSKLGKLIGIQEGKQDITASYEYEGINPTEKINLSIDMSATGFGIYELTVTAKDLNNDNAASKTIKFGVQDAEINYLF